MLIASKASRTGALGRSKRLFMAVQRSHRAKLRRLNSCDQPSVFGIPYSHSVRVKGEYAR